MKFLIKKKFYFQFIKKKNFSSFKNVFFLLSLTYFLVYFLNNLGEISFEIDLEKKGHSIILSFLFCILSIYFNAFAWKNIVHWFGKRKIKKKLISFYVLTYS